ncbi:MAG: fumarylacetoacetate hydrolase family protein [Spirochaetota bacterium]
MKLIKFRNENFVYPQFAMVDADMVYPVKNHFRVSDLFTAIQAGNLEYDEPLQLDAITPLPPTDDQVNIYCAGLNYRDHAEEMGMPIPPRPVFFTKSDGCLTASGTPVLWPEEVQLLDYEVELACIVGRRIGKDDQVRPDNLCDYLLGITIFNDVTARDMQLSGGQWFMGKNYRTFAPLGPYVQTCDSDTGQRLGELRLELQVYDEHGTPYPHKSQEGTTSMMIFPVYQLLDNLRTHFDLQPGDVIATGTPRGVALSRPSPFLNRVADIIGISQSTRIRKFINREIRKNDRYLRPGDIMISRITSPDMVIDLGEQKNQVHTDTE